MATGWQAITTDTDVAEGAKGSWVQLKPYEGAHCHAERTDGGSTATWVVQVWTSIDDGTTVPDDPIMEYSVDPSKTKIDFGFEGPFKSVALGTKAVSGDAVVLTLKVKPNGGLE